MELLASGTPPRRQTTQAIEAPVPTLLACGAMTISCFDLSGRVALVTGASKGLGKAIAAGLGAAGADLVLVSRTTSDLEATAEELRSSGRRVYAIAADVTREDQVAAMTATAIDKLGRIDILVNNAGVGLTQAFTDMEREDWDRVLAVNLTAPMLCCKHVGKHLLRQRSGKVINVASVLATHVARQLSAYSASKAALVQMTRVLALEWIRRGVQVNALCPGYFRTDMNEEFFASERGQRFVAELPIGRLGEHHELAGAAVFLASDASSYVTGTTLYVDGGHALA